MIGRVYKIVDGLSEDVYIGSTTQKLSVRFGKHYYGASSVIGKLMKEHGKSRYSIILIKEYQVADKRNLEAYEQLWMNKTKCINKQSAFCVKHLYKISLKDHIKECQRAYNEANKDKISQKACEYYEANKDKISQKKREYYEANKEQINQKRSQKIDCECGGKYTLRNRSKHMKTKKHLAAFA